MKYLYTISFILFLLTSTKSQTRPELIWTDSIGGLAFLKKEQYVKLEFQLDSFSVDTMRNEEFFKDLPKQGFFATYKKSFESAFNEEFGGKTTFNESLSNSYYNYVLKITPLKYYIIIGPCMDRRHVGDIRMIPGSQFLFGDYVFEIYSKNGGKPLYRMVAKQMMNPIPKYSKCAPEKYNSDFNTNVVLNFSTMGQYAAKHIRKLFKK